MVHIRLNCTRHGPFQGVRIWTRNPRRRTPSMSRPGSRPRFPSGQKARAWQVNQSLRATFALAGWPACVRQGSPSLCNERDEANGGDKWIGMPRAQAAKGPSKGVSSLTVLCGHLPSWCGVQFPLSTFTLLVGLEISSHATALSADLRRRRELGLNPLHESWGQELSAAWGPAY